MEKIKKNSLLILCSLLIVTTIVLGFLVGFNDKKAGCDLPAYQRVNSLIDRSRVYSFAGENVPLDDEEVFERLDRELTINSYYHSSTISSLKLSHKFFPIIEPILAKYGIPDDFKYLAVAESGLRNETSPAGAKGVWQFMTGTAKQYNLFVSNQIDERYDLEKSTTAACSYFLDAYKQFGSWTAVAAAYNMGTAGYQKRVNKQMDANYYNLYLNAETSRYVFRIIAMKEIMSDPIRYGFVYNPNVDGYNDPPSELKTIPVPVGDLPVWAKENNTNYKMLRFLNPWIIDDEVTSYPYGELIVKVPTK